MEPSGRNRLLLPVQLVPFQAGARCVDVWNGNYGNNGWNGITYFSYVAGTTYRFAENGVSITLNDYYVTNFPNDNKPRSVACHELGHALGLDHNTSQTSCLGPGGANRSLTPNPNDYSQLTYNTYSVYRAP